MIVWLAEGIVTIGIDMTLATEVLSGMFRAST